MPTIEQNKAAREDAEAFAKLVDELDQPERYWQIVLDAAKRRLAPPDTEMQRALGPMNDNEAAEFERQTMPYGAFVGVKIGEVSCGYLAWFVDSDAFKNNLRRYVQSTRFRNRYET